VAITTRFRHVEKYLDERTRRLLVAAEVLAAGQRSIRKIARVTGMSRNTVRSGIRELQKSKRVKELGDRIRRPGGGRKKVELKDPLLLPALERLVAPATRGDPMSPLRWTSKSTKKLAQELHNQGHKVRDRTVSRLLGVLGYSLQANSKSREPRSSNPDRNKQFEFINKIATERMRDGQPVVSVDTKKKELVGDFKNGGKEYQPKGEPELVQVHDFITDSKGKVSPYGVYDEARNDAWVSVGTDHDTSSFAVQSIRNWWRSMGRHSYPNANSLLITADSGGSNGSRVRLWKMEIQRLADDLSIPITVCHFPPGTSKWNKIEHRLFSHITMNWRGKPLISHETVVNLIAGTTTRTGLKVRARLDTNPYPRGRKISAAEMKSLNITFIGPHEGWSYTIIPRES
jgi:transposase